jgi:hypothetical protein
MAVADGQNAELVKELLALIEGKQAHVDLAKAVKDFPVEMRGVVPEKLPYSAWQLIEHLRITQRDILEFCAPPTGGYQPMEWPKAYWPESAEPPYPVSWDQTLAAIESDRRKFEALLQKPGVDLYKPFRWGDGQNLLREAMLIADHNAYHLGELVVLRRLLGIWKA